jgi:hypothetical protein
VDHPPPPHVEAFAFVVTVKAELTQPIVRVKETAVEFKEDEVSFTVTRSQLFTVHTAHVNEPVQTLYCPHVMLMADHVFVHATVMVEV